VLQLVSEQVGPSGQVEESCCVEYQLMYCYMSCLFFCVVWRTKMAGRNDVVIAAALEVVAQAVGQQPNGNAGANAEVRMLETFLRNHPPTFKGRYDPDGAQTWLKEIERVLIVMQCTEVHKVRFGTHTLVGEADDWWIGLLPILEQDGAEVTWVVFKREFLDRYFLEDVRGKKEIEFLELKQGNMSVTGYAAKFVELASSIHIILLRLLSSPNESSSRMGCVLISRGQLVTRRSEIFPSW